MFRAISTALILTFISTPSYADIRFWKMAWKNTDFSKTSIDFSEVFDGGPGKDGIPSLSNPEMISVSKEKHLQDREPVMTVEIEGQQPRAYPIRYLMWHEIVNDSAGDVDFAVTFCPLCNSGIVFDRALDGETYSFGVSGLLRNSDMIMFDRETETWWQQFSGEAIVGNLLGKELTKLPSWMESWTDYKARNPNGLVQNIPTQRRQYGENPYAGYDGGSFSLYTGENPPHDINPVERVVVVGNSAWPLARLRNNSPLTENEMTFTWQEGTASALDTRNIAQGKDVGSIRVKNADGQDIVHDVAFAFAFHAFHPKGNWMIGD